MDSASASVDEWKKKYLKKDSYLNSHSLKNKLFELKIFEPKCNSCGISHQELDGASLHLDHIDGDRKNNLLENLDVLCPNCHSQTETFCRQGKRVGPAYCCECGIMMARSDRWVCVICQTILGEEKLEEILLDPIAYLDKHKLGECIECKITVPVNAFLCLDCNPRKKSERKREKESLPKKKYAYPYKTRTRTKTKTCLDCPRLISEKADRCKSCAAKERSTEKIKWPSDEELLKLVAGSNFVQAGKVLGVSDNAIRKRLRKRGHQV